MKRVIIFLATMLSAIMLLQGGMASAEFAPQFQALTDKIDEGIPVSIQMTAKLHDWVPFDESTIASLNLIMDSLSISMYQQNKDGKQTDHWSIIMNQVPVVTNTSIQTPTKYALVSNLVPDQVYTSANINPLSLMADGAGDIALGEEEDQWLFQVPEWSTYIDGICEAMAPYGVDKKVSKKFTSIGTAKQSVVYTLTQEEAMALMETLVPTISQRWLADILVGLSFSGSQKVTVYKDDEGIPLAITASGKMSHGAGTQRTVTLQWGFKETAEERVDTISLKSPQVNGKDRTTITYKRTESFETGQNALSISNTIDTTTDGVKIKSVLKASLQNMLGADNQRITGEISTETTQNDVKNTKTIQPTILTVKSGDDICAKCSFRIIMLEGKRTQLDTTLSVNIDPCVAMDVPMPAIEVLVDTLDPAQIVDLREEYITNMTYQLVSAILTLPEEDLAVFSKGLSDENWQLIMDAVAQLGD